MYTLFVFLYKPGVTEFNLGLRPRLSSTATVELEALMLRFQVTALDPDVPDCRNLRSSNSTYTTWGLSAQISWYASRCLRPCIWLSYAPHKSKVFVWTVKE